MDTMRVMSFGQKSRFFIDGPCSSRGMSCFRLCRKKKKKMRTATVNAVLKIQQGSSFFGRVTTLAWCASKAPTRLKVLDLTPLADSAICSPHAESTVSYHTDLQSATNSHTLSFCTWPLSEKQARHGTRKHTHTHVRTHRFKEKYSVDKRDVKRTYACFLI